MRMGRKSKVYLMSVLILMILSFSGIYAQFNINNENSNELTPANEQNNFLPSIINHQSPHHFREDNDYLTIAKPKIIAHDGSKTISPSPDEGFTTIYADHDNGLFGRSIYRTLLMTTHNYLFKRTDTHYVDKEIGSYLTAVVVKNETIKLLQEMMTGRQSLYLGDNEFSIDALLMNVLDNRDINSTVYNFTNNLFQLSTSFSVEKPTQELFDMIEQVYSDKPNIKDFVINHYKNNYILRIHAAENFLEPWNYHISMNEALMMATYLGDTVQPLWGIADGNNALAIALSLQQTQS